MPQAMSALWPMTTPGRPEKEKPATSNGQASSTCVQCRPTWYQMLGMPGARCGSLASSGRPDSVCVPETTQEFDPTPSPRPSRSGTASSAAWADSSAERPARTARRVSASAAGSAAAGAVAAVASAAAASPWARSAPASEAPAGPSPGRIGAWVSAGYGG